MKSTKTRDIYFEQCPFAELFENCPKKIKDRLIMEYGRDLPTIEVMAYDQVIASTKINIENYIRWKETRKDDD